MLYDLAIIGAGYWGTAIAIEARKKGLEVIVVDSGQETSGSRNSSGILHPSAYEQSWCKKLLPEDWTPSDLEDSFCWLEENVGFTTADEFFLNFYGGNSQLKVRDKAYMIADNESFLSKDFAVTGKVERVFNVGDAWTVDVQLPKYHQLLTTKKIVIAAGIWTDQILAASDLKQIGVTSLEGRGALFKKTQHSLNKPMPLTVLWKPYMKYTFRTWGDMIRLGDTVERPNAKERYPDLLTLASHVMGEYDFQGWMRGYRPVTEKFLVKEIEPGMIVATGGYRAGLGLSGLVAKKVMELI